MSKQQHKEDDEFSLLTSGSSPENKGYYSSIPYTNANSLLMNDNNSCAISYSEKNNLIFEQKQQQVEDNTNSLPIIDSNAAVTRTSLEMNNNVSKKLKPNNEKAAQATGKAKLDFIFLKRFFFTIIYSLWKVPTNSDYNTFDENGKLIKPIRVIDNNNQNLNKKNNNRFIQFLQKLSLLNISLILFFLILCIGEIFIGNEVGKLPGNFYLVIITYADKKDDKKYSEEITAAFIKVFLISGAWIIGITILKTIRQWFSDLMIVCWRKNLTFHLQRRYFENGNFYKLILLDKRIDNTDQRITKDIEDFISSTIKFIESLFTGPITVVYYTVTVSLAMGWEGPVFCYLFFIVGSIINKLIISPISNLWFTQERYEGDYRYLHALLRTNAESVAFYGGQENERVLANQKLKGVVRNRFKISLWTILLNCHMNLFGYVGAILSYLVIAAAIFWTGSFLPSNNDGTVVTPGEIASKVSQASFQVMMLIYGFTTFIQTGNNLSTLAGYTARLGEMREVMNDIEKDPELSSIKITTDSLTNITTIESKENDQLIDYIEFNNVSIFVPKTLEKYHTSKCLVKNLTFTIKPHQHTLIIGPSGCGKSSMLRVLADLWPLSSGQISKPFTNTVKSKVSEMFYVSQEPYTSIGSLRDQITYPLKSSSADSIDHEKLLEAIRLANLEYIFDRADRDWDSQCNWSELLSPGERQRLAIARVIYHKPKFVILDESTSACDVNIEQKIYTLLKEQGSTLISVGHRPTLRKFHTHILELDGTGQWNFREINNSNHNSDEDEEEFF
ncbi:hypothetical protein ABK040_011340 [Willaertia magna]